MHVFRKIASGKRLFTLAEDGGQESMKNSIANREGETTCGRPLIVSYSYSGNTHRIAQKIQSATDGDWCEIYPWQPYPMAFPELLEQVKKEVQAHYRPRLLPVSYSPHSYSVILAGTPNWCGTIAPPLASWLYKNDLSGKIILPFYSHCGGVSGRSPGRYCQAVSKCGCAGSARSIRRRRRFNGHTQTMV